MGALSSILNPLLFEFVLGMWIAKAILCGKKLNPYLATFILFASLAVICSTDLMTQQVTEGNGRFFWWGVPSAFILWSSVSLEKYVRSYLQGIASFLGNASYSIYLVQSFTMAFFAVIFKELAFVPFGLQLAICTLLTIIAGCFLHVVLEKPMTKILQKKAY